jgi:ketosteroid isomerase-like protein
MKINILIIGLLSALSGLIGCDSNSPGNGSDSQTKETTLKQILEAFNKHDPDAIMEHFVDDCTFDFPRGSEPWGKHFTGKEQVREAIAGRFKGIPDVHYEDAGHWVAGDKGMSKWMLSGTTTSGDSVNVRICVLWEFHKDKVTHMDTYWKIIER